MTVEFEEYQICFEKFLAWVNIKVYEIATREIDSEKLYYNKKGYTGSGDWVETIDEAEIFMSGYIKWDGCCEFKFLDVGHFCRYDHLQSFADLLVFIHTEAGRMMDTPLEGEFKEWTP